MSTAETTETAETAARSRAAPLVGREPECAALDRLLGDIRGGTSRALVLSGAPGVGKTALLDRLVERAAGICVVSLSGVQSTMELAFSALHRLCVPLFDRLGALPPPQADALRVTLGLSEGPVPDRLMVGLAVLSLLAEAAADRPLLCVLDDVHWLDSASAGVLAFVARRLAAESVGLVFATRIPGAELDGLPTVRIDGLDRSHAGALLDTMLAFRVDERVRDQIVADTHGNPLALQELSRELTAARLSGGFGLSAAFRGPAEAREMYRRRIAALSADSRRLLVLAAADPTGDAALLWSAAAGLGVSPHAARSLTEAGLVDFGARIRFRHPLVRSAAYRSASEGQVRAAHAALAAATDPVTDPDRHAWHRAEAATDPDGQVAEELERSAERAHARGGIAAAAAFLERATALTPDPVRRSRRALAAARAKLAIGAFAAARELLTAVDGDEAADHAHALLLRAAVAFGADRDRRVPAMLLEAAEEIWPRDETLARVTLLDALRAAIYVGRFAEPGADVAAVVRAASALPSPPVSPSGQALDGLVADVTRHSRPLPPFLDALRRIGYTGTDPDDDPRWLSLLAFVASGVWDYAQWDVVTARFIDVCRAQGALSELRLALTARTFALLVAGKVAAAGAGVAELRATLSATESSMAAYSALALAAFEGREDEATALARSVIGDADARGEGLAITGAEWALALLHNGLGHHGLALDAAHRAVSSPAEELGLRNWALAELVEAAVRTGDLVAAFDALQLLTATTRGIESDWAQGIQARAAALLATGEEAEEGYREAIARLDRIELHAEAARARLLYGEWLRREHRRGAARTQLRAAHEMFTKMGMEGYAQRARRELRAAGEATGAQLAAEAGALTAQERQIAQLAREGLTNPEIGTRLFISARTVEYHLGKVFHKLGITSRAQLDRALH